MSDLIPGASILRLGYEAFACCIAGELDQARHLTKAFVVHVDRFSDVMWHAELVLMLAIAKLRGGEAETALLYSTAAQRAGLFFGYFYRLARQCSASASDMLPDMDSRQSAIQRGGALGVEEILDRELRTPVEP